MIKKLLKEFNFLKQFRTQNICDSFDRVGTKISLLLQTNRASLIELCGLTNKHSKEIEHLRNIIGNLVNRVEKLVEKVDYFETRTLKKLVIESHDVMEPFNKRFREMNAYYEEKLNNLQTLNDNLQNKLNEKEAKNETIHRTTKRKSRNVKKGKTLYDF